MRVPILLLSDESAVKSGLKEDVNRKNHLLKEFFQSLSCFQ